MVRAISTIILLLGLMSCHKLVEEDLEDNFIQNHFDKPEDFVAFAEKPYRAMDRYMSHFGLFMLQELQSDEMIAPKRLSGPALFPFSEDFIDAHLHQLEPTSLLARSTLEFLYEVIILCNDRIIIFEEQDPSLAAPFIAEMRVLRALMYTWLMDVFGKVSLTERIEDFKAFPQVERTVLFEYIETEILESLPHLTKAENTISNAKIDYYTAQALLSHLYLNAEIYAETTRFNETIKACDEIINAQLFELETDYYACFKMENSSSQEIIFAIPYDSRFLRGFTLHRLTLHPQSALTFNLNYPPRLFANLLCTTEEFYNSFSDQDIRKESFIEGPQFDQLGQPLLDSIEDPRDTNGLHINYTPSIYNISDALPQDGVRIGKFEFGEQTKFNMDNDFPIFRYAEILLNKAEALWRKNPSNAEALQLVNLIRARAGLTPFEVLNAENILEERGRELAFEGKRRTDLIRFGVFGIARGFKPTSEVCRELVPLPAIVISNSNWFQNPCY